MRCSLFQYRGGEGDDRLQMAKLSYKPTGRGDIDAALAWIAELPDCCLLREPASARITRIWLGQAERRHEPIARFDFPYWGWQAGGQRWQMFRLFTWRVLHPDSPTLSGRLALSGLDVPSHFARLRGFVQQPGPLAPLLDL